jgi:hypothetical protein
MYSCWGGSNQIWIPLQASRQLRLNNASGLCLQAEAAAGPLVVADCDRVPSQVFLQSVTDGITLPSGAVLRYRDATPETYLVRKQYHVYAQFTRFIRPGDVILQLTGDAAATTVMAQKRNGTLVVVAVNGNGSPQTLTYNLAGFLPAGASRAEGYQTTAQSDCAAIPSVPLSGQQLVFQAPATSITTLLLFPGH